ncbi:hypothetical protein evm_007447 [Chilo suppressalis]|nr:hypothetical protein evm_007447 [Chilo suppressalis]
MAFVKGLVFVCIIISLANGHNNTPNVGIIGGHTVSIEQVPFMISLRLNGTYHWCGGSIIHERFVLTAAHCIVPHRDFKVLVGTDSVNNDGQLYDIDEIIPHEEYSSTTQDNDICLIKLSTSLVFGPKVARIELADDSLKLKKGSMVAITGWGDTMPGGNITQHLLQVQIPVVTRPACQRMYFALLRPVTPNMMCAGGNGKDSCQSDSGGPLTYENKQVGLASFGAGCGKLPGVYTRISAFITWINETIEQKLIKNEPVKKETKNKRRKNKNRRSSKRAQIEIEQFE